MKHKVFILGVQRIDQKSEIERLGEMRKGRREMIERDYRKEKMTKRQFEQKEGLRVSRSDPEK